MECTKTRQKIIEIAKTYQGKEVIKQEQSPPCVVATIASNNYISLESNRYSK